MTAELDTFLVEIRTHPLFVAAANKDSVWIEHFDALEHTLRYAERSDGPKTIDLSDAVRSVVKRQEWTLKDRLYAIQELLAAYDPKRSKQ